MTEEIASVARKLLATESGEPASTEVASRAASACEQLVRCLARLLGEAGTEALLHRSVRLASASFPWLASAGTRSGRVDATDALRTCLASQPPAVAAEAFVLILSTFVGLLGRLIGEGLVTRILHELWPAITPARIKEMT